MARSALENEGYRPLFSGHQTFPLRYGWLKKAFDAVQATKEELDNRFVFLDPSAIGRFGVGKNMVAAIRHWATSTGVIEEGTTRPQFLPTEFGRNLFGTNGLDPFLEEQASLWHLHWALCSGFGPAPLKTTWYWVFNHFPRATFHREELVEGLIRLAEEYSWGRASRTTIQRDVECFLRMYEWQFSAGETVEEGVLESPMAELRLIHRVGNEYRLVRTRRPSLPAGVFVRALLDFWRTQGNAQTLSFELIAFAPGSPGRVFMLDEEDLGDRLIHLSDISRGRLVWSETAGVRQVLRVGDIGDEDIRELIAQDYTVGGPAR